MEGVTPFPYMIIPLKGEVSNQNVFSMSDKRQKQQGRTGRMKHGRKSQTGVALLEALIAILVFSLGMLTVIGIQAASIKMAADAQLRTRAALLADRLVGRMWTSGLDIGELKTAFESPNGNDYKTWLAEVGDYEKFGLPGVAGGSEEDGVMSTLPEVEVMNAAGASNGQVVVTLYWRTPSMPNGERHRHIITSQISRNP
jgi:type IV pilus assembly protein PilV